MKKPNWLHRDLILGPFLCLCISEDEFTRVKRYLKVNDPTDFPGAGWGCVRQYHKDGKMTCVVLLGDVSMCEPLQIVGLLTHEAVHVWQAYCGHIGESTPSREFEAYSIQAISQRLHYAYREQALGTKDPSK